jgi:hypothetical protein
MKLDGETSVRVLSLIRIVVGECYDNCKRTIEGIDEFAQATYVEGYLCLDGSLLEHAWIERSRRIIDPSAMAVQLNLGLPYAQRDVVNARYYPAIKIRGRAGLWEHCLLHDREPPYFYDFEPARMRRAYRRAWKSVWGKMPEEIARICGMTTKPRGKGFPPRHGDDPWLGYDRP